MRKSHSFDWPKHNFWSIYMGANRSSYLPLGIMVVSLILLGLFEFSWLKKEYQDQEDWLHSEQNDQLVHAIRSLEDSLFEEMVLTPLQVRKDSLEFISPRGSRLLFERGKEDSAQVMTIVRSINVPKQKKSQRSERGQRYRNHYSMMLGALSLHLAEGKDSVLTTLDLSRLIKEKLEEQKGSAPDLHYVMTTWPESDTSSAIAGLASRPYFDAGSKQHFAIVYPEYNNFILKRILPQILFALLLFAGITTAFYLIYRSLRKQQKLAVLRNDFINNITHELKTPISTVRVALEALQSFNVSSDPKRAMEYMEISQNELDRLTILVDKVLKMSNFENSNTELKIEQFDFKEMVNQILATMKVQFNRVTASVEFTTDGDDFDVEGDRLHLTGVLYNLIDNALKYSPEKKEINIQLHQYNGSVTLEVKDHGQGISAEHKGKIFDKFYRIPNGDHHNVKGHGLGLSYVAEVVAQHHGSITVDSQHGKGSKFTLTLPKQHAN